MRTNRVELGFSALYVTVNGKQIYFESEEVAGNSYDLDDGTEVFPSGAMKITVDISGCYIGDMIEVGFENAELESDGGGERRSNMVGTVGNYTVALGCMETHDIESEYLYFGGDPSGRALPYEIFGLRESGYLFRIVDDPTKYTKEPDQTAITVDAFWEDSSKEYAWKMLSCLTC